MRKILLILAMLTSLIANAYEPMIREDRIWEFYEAGNSPEIKYVSKIVKYRFSGTETKNGVTYNVLNIMWEDGRLEPVALMREDVEHRTVYLYSGQDYLTFKSTNRQLNIDLGKNQEVLLYNIPSWGGFDIMPYGSVKTLDDILAGGYELNYNFHPKNGIYSAVADKK